MARHATLQIMTPEGIAFSLRLASPFTRLLALAIDFAILTTAQSILVVNLKLVGLLSNDLAGMLIVLGSFALDLGYRIWLEWAWRGQTVGKRILRLRVMDERGLKIQFHQIVVRNLLRFVDVLPAFYLTGGIASWISRRGQRLGDLAAGTIVAREPAAGEPDVEQLTGGKFNSFRAYPHLEARLRQQVLPAEAHAAVQALLRREELEPAARVALFAALAARLRQAAEFPSEITADLSDEQYVRNVVESLYRRADRERAAAG